MNKEVLIRYDRCLGCKSCELACAVAHSASKSLSGAISHDEKPRKRVFVHQVDDKKIPMNCRHCEDAPCIDACITGAMYRTADGTVTNEGGKQGCIGCWMCVMVCPYGVIRSLPQERKALKCDRDCLDENGAPACVRACPTGALMYTEVELFSTDRRQEYLSNALAERKITNP